MSSSVPSKKPSTTFSMVQLLVTFIIPVIILLRLSDESSLGPVKSLLLALAFPIGFELYNLSQHKKPSMFSALAIGGIAVTGLISLLGLSEEWLAVRRAVPYLAASLALFVSILLDRSLLALLLPHVLDMDKVRRAADKKQVTPALDRLISRSTYLLCILLLALALVSYVMTKVIIESATNTASFNQEYAQLRLLSLATISLPMVLGVTGILFYMVNTLEKLTGLDFEDILKKK